MGPDDSLTVYFFMFWLMKWSIAMGTGGSSTKKSGVEMPTVSIFFGVGCG